MTDPVANGSWESRISKHFTANGSAIVPPRIARWLEAKAGITTAWRNSLMTTDPEAYGVLLALRMAALRHSSGIGTNHAETQPEQPPLAAWISTTEAAREMNVSDRCVRKWINGGRLPATRAGARWLINRNDLHAHKLAA
jgi:excisionase family DNA binding protein